MLFQVVESLTSAVETRQLDAIHNEDTLLNIALTSLLRPAADVPAKPERNVALLAFSRHVADLHAAADASQQENAEVQLRTVLSDLEQVKRFYDPKLLEAAQANADRWTCAMHPDVVGAKGSECPKCGMPLDQLIRPSPFDNGGTPPVNSVKAQITTTAPLQRGENVSGVLQLRHLTGDPVLPSELREVHTQKIHLLVIDGSLSDYHHLHPTPIADQPGAYAFTFTPAKPGPYRAWADIRPNVSGLQEYAMADIAGQGAGEPITARETQLNTTVNGFRYELALAPAEPKVGEVTHATLRITDGDGKPFTALEPVMAAFAHLVGFSEDGHTVIHSHPRGKAPANAEERGGPELEFQLFPTVPGLMRLFAQVQINGESSFAPFTVNVAPR